jgi:predicted ATP-grasp superfamily ATP-dependent carboligase
MLIPAASDKWEMYRLLHQAGVPTIETCLGSSDEWRAWDFPIAKPRDGAGSQDVRQLNRETTLNDRLIVQPSIRGAWLSCTLFLLRSGNHILFPPAEQRIADDGRFTYLGGVVPARCDVDRVQSLARRAVGALVDDWNRIDSLGLGPVGVDLVEDERTGNLLVCEINPRFTTSYIAFRELSETNLLAGLIHSDAPLPTWKPQRLEFDAAGAVWVVEKPGFESVSRPCVA